MKHYSKKYFNMVEIVLALAVVSVAIVSLMGVLPVALRASKSSVEENNVVSVQAIMKAYIDGKYNAYKDSQSATFANFLSDFYDASTVELSKAAPYDFSNKSKRQLSSADMKKFAFQITSINSSGAESKGIFLVEYFSGEFKDNEFAKVDAAYDVRLYYKPFDGILYVPYHMPYKEKPKNAGDIMNEENVKKKYYPNLIFSGNTESDFKDGSAAKVDLQYGCTFYLEVSHPSGVSYDKQTHRLFKYNYFRKIE